MLAAASKKIFFSFLLLATCLLLAKAAITEKATGVAFAPRLQGLPLMGVGVRSKGPIKIYAVAAYGSIKKADTKEQAKRALASSPRLPVTFYLQFAFSVSAEKVAGSIADALSTRSASKKDVEAFSTALVTAIQDTCPGGKVSKGTTLQLDCTSSGLVMKLNGRRLSGSVGSSSLSRALCQVYFDGRSVSPALKEDCAKRASSS